MKRRTKNKKLKTTTQIINDTGISYSCFYNVVKELNLKPEWKGYSAKNLIQYKLWSSSIKKKITDYLAIPKKDRPIRPLIKDNKEKETLENWLINNKPTTFKSNMPTYNQWIKIPTRKTGRKGLYK